MRRNDLQTGVVYSWSEHRGGRGGDKGVFVDLGVVRTSVQGRSSTMTIQKSSDHDTYWGRRRGGYMSDPITRRGFLAVVGEYNADDAALLQRAASYADEVTRFHPEGATFTVDTTQVSGIAVVAPREVVNTWAGYLAERERESAEFRKAEQRDDHDRQAAHEARAAVTDIYGPLPRFLSRHDRMEVSAAWLAATLGTDYEKPFSNPGEHPLRCLYCLTGRIWATAAGGMACVGVLPGGEDAVTMPCGAEWNAHGELVAQPDAVEQP